jgi:hypothetical protein
VLYQSEHSNGHVACGIMGGIADEKGIVKLDSRVLSFRSMLFHPPEFTPAKAMGTKLPCRCPACKNCKECRFQMYSLSFKENTEYEIILSKLKLDVDQKKWVARYPFNTLVERLIGNFTQARWCMGKMEARLVKTGRLDEFNQQFQDNVDRGVFKSLTRKEADNYKGSINTSAWWRHSKQARTQQPP